MREMILQALKSKISGQINGHIANIEAMMTNPVGIGEHPQIIEEAMKQLDNLATAEGKIIELKKQYGNNLSLNEMRKISDMDFGGLESNKGKIIKENLN